MSAEKLVWDYLQDFDISREQLYLLYSIELDGRIMPQIEKIAKEMGFQNVKWLQAGAMIPSHAGPGGFGISGLEV
jgi:hypothetical protein